VESSEQQLVKIISLEKAFGNILVQEINSFKKPSEYTNNINRHSALCRNFVDILSDTEDEYITERLDYSEKYFYANMEVRFLTNSVNRFFTELVNSIRYIHEHHIVYLKNLLQNEPAKIDYFGDENFHRNSGESNSEINIIKTASSMKAVMLDIVLIFKETEQQFDLAEIRKKFSQKMEQLTDLINAFESYSLDAQDGILVEDLLRTSRELVTSFSNLLKIENDKDRYTKLREEKTNTLMQSFHHKNEEFAQANKKLKQTIKILQLISFILVILIASVIILFGKKTKDEASKTVEETLKIQENVLYQIPVDKNLSIEFQIVFRTLNLMTNKINSYIQQIEANEKQYRLLVENQTDMIAKFSRNGHLNFVSPSLCRTFNQTQERLFGKPFIELFDKNERQEIQNIIEEISNPPHNSYIEVLTETKNGERYQAWLHTAVLDEKGKLDSIIGVGRDIHDQKLAEEAIKKLSRAVEASPVCVVITDKKGNIEYANPKFVEVTGYSLEETIGQNPRILNSGRQPAEMYKKLWQSITSGNEWHGEFCNRKKNGDIYWESAAIAPITNKSGNITHYVAVKEDITERRNYENNLREARKSAEAATKAKSQFLANMSHEIRTPLNSLLGFIEIVLEDSSLPKKHYKHLKIAQSSGVGLLNLINDILDISKLEQGKLTIENSLFNLNLFMEEICRTMELKIQEKDLKLLVDIDPALSESLIGDPFRLKQVIVNLVSNAIKFTEKGRITIRIVPLKDKELLQFSVEDTGIGIPADRLNQIFESFTQVDNSTTRQFGGTGLGTTISKELVELMGGRIWAESTFGKGSTFYFTIKTMITGQVLKKNDTIITSDKSDYHKFRHGFKVLLVEDIKVNVELVKIRLEKQDHEVTVAWNGLQAVEIIKSQKRFDVILMDIHMPEMNGLEATRQIREFESNTEKNIPIIAMTAGVMKDEKEEYLSSGMNAVVSKPIDFILLFTTIEKIIPEDIGWKFDVTTKESNDLSILELSSLTGVDTTTGLKNWQDPKVYLEALLTFSQDYKDVVTKLKRFIDQYNLEDAYQITHALKGVAGNLSMVDIADIVTIIDTKIRKEQLVEINKQISDLDLAIKTVISEIQNLNASKNKDEVLEKEIDMDKLKEIFGKLLSVLDQFNPFEAEPFLSELKTHVPAKQLHPIEKYIKTFDCENAKQEIIKLTKNLKIKLE